jgi:hypothetical protein
MSRSCVCGGSNENCRYCGGLGTIDDGLADALVDHAQRNRTAESAAPEPPTVEQQILAIVRQGVHVCCPVPGCFAYLKKRGLTNHLKRTHKILSFSLQHSAYAKAPKVDLQVEPQGELQPHSPQGANNSVAGYAVSISIPDGTPRISSFAQAPERNLDATKGYAHAYRENGRFGSHPSHDGFDGEADPD